MMDRTGLERFAWRRPDRRRGGGRARRPTIPRGEIQPMTIALHQLMAMGQTVWLDSISRDLIQSGALTVLIARGIRGGTIDPGSYAPTVTRRRGGDWLVGPLAARDAEPTGEALLLGASRQTAELLRAIYEQSRGQDGFASVPITPCLAHDTTGTVAE